MNYAVFEKTVEGSPQTV